MATSPNTEKRPNDGIEKPEGLKELPSYIVKKVSGFFKRLFYIFGLVWKAAPFMLVLMIFFCVLDGLLPVVGAFITSGLLNGIADIIAKTAEQSSTIGGDLDSIIVTLKPVVFLFVLNLVYLFLNRILRRLSTMVTGISGELVINHIKLSIIEKAATLDSRSFDTPAFYEKLENANREASMRPISILNATFNMISAAIGAISFVIVLSTLSPFAPFAMLIAAIPGAIVNLIYRNRNFRYVRWHSKDRVEMNYYSSLMVDKDKFSEIKILGLSGTFIKKYKSAFDRYYKGLRGLIVKEGVTQITVSLVATVVNSILFAYIAFTVIAGHGKVGDYSLYSGALTSIAAYITTLLTSTVTIYEGTLFIDNMLEFMKEKTEIVPINDTPLIPMKDTPHTIELVNVSFKYPGTERYVLKNVSLKIEHGESVVLVGLNGAGKSTLIKLITRLYDPTEGSVYLDGHDIKEYDVKSLYALFGIIFQNYGKYADTAAENIRYGDTDFDGDIEDIAIAARRGGAAGFIAELPDGYDTPLTRMFRENGVELSGGQWQKISVSRAFYKDSDILILDEPTSSLDPLAEQDVFEQFARLSKNKTSIFVSHKLSSAVTAGKIVVIDGGEICESGTHDELMKLRGKYYELFSTQARRYTGEEL